MNFKDWPMRILYGALLVVVLAGCGSPAPTQEPTADIQPTVNAVRTESALTVVADLTLNAPTATPIPSATSTATQTLTPPPTITVLPSATATATFIPWTATPSATATDVNWSCLITAYSPALDTVIAPGTDFDGSWTIKNTGQQTWPMNEIDIMYAYGTKFQESRDAVDLETDLAYGGTYTVTVDMRSPDTVGTYTTTWTVNYGGQVMCTVTLRIKVQ